VSFLARLLPRLLLSVLFLEKITYVEKENFLTDYDDCLTSYESQFRSYRMGLDEDAQVGSVLASHYR
jgi:hypothetical protein